MKDCVSSLHVGLRILTLCALFLDEFNICDSEGCFSYGNKPTVTRKRPLYSIPFFNTLSRILNLITRGGTPQPFGSYALYQGSIEFAVTKLWLRRETFTATPMFLRIWRTDPFRVTTRRYVLSFISRPFGSNSANAIQAGRPNILSSVLF